MSECPGCAEGKTPVLLDEDGTLVAISGKPGRIGHAVDDFWWYCGDYNPHVDAEMHPLVAYSDDPSGDTVHHPYLAYNQGFEAAERGYSLEQCPYPTGRERRFWQDGWKDQQAGAEP